MPIKSKIPPKSTPILPDEVPKSYENNASMGQKSQHSKGSYLRLPFYLNIVKPL